MGADPTVEAGDPLAALHRAHYTSLVRLATLVVGDVGMAEQVTQDAFVKLQLRWGGLRDPAKAPAYLRSAVLNGARSQLRRRRVGDRHDARRTVAPAAITPESATVGRAEHERVVAALRRLPAPPAGGGGPASTTSTYPRRRSPPPWACRAGR